MLLDGFHFWPGLLAQIHSSQRKPLTPLLPCGDMMTS